MLYGGTWNESDNFVGYQVSDISLHDGMKFIHLQQRIIETLGNVGHIDAPDIYVCIGSQSFIKKDAQINTDVDVQWLITIMTYNIDEYCALVIDYKNTLSGMLDNIPHYASTTNSHSLQGRVFRNIDVTKISSNFTIQVEDIYVGKCVLHNALRGIAIRDSFQYKTVKSNKKSLIVQCVYENCKWLLRACRYGDNESESWIIVRFDSEHTCSLDIVLMDHKQASFSVIKDCIQSLINIDGSSLPTPKEIRNYVLTQHGLRISYQKAWRARELAINEIRGSPEDSYKMIPSFAHVLKMTNPGSITEIKLDDAGRFKFFFMAFAACISGWKHCRPVISVDGTHMKNKYAGTLITASAYDPNDQIFPIAFCVVDSENDNSWLWFFSQLKQIVVEQNDLVIVSDRHKSIGKAIQIAFPNAFHCICMVHLLKNLKLIYKSKINDTIYYACAKAFNVVDFEHQMRQLEMGARGIRNELNTIGLAKWSRAFSPRSRYKMMTTNISESLNAAIKKARDLPIVSMLEVLRMTMQRWFYERRNECAFQATTFTKATEEHLREQIHLGRFMQVNPIDNIEYQVIDQTRQYNVHLARKRCSCRMWDTLQIPCSHACAVLTTKYISTKEYISPYYLNSTLSSIYSGLLYPLGHEDSWVIPEDVKQIVVLPPNVKRSVGRPKKNRIPSQMEFKRRVKCSRCGKLGHNRKSCRFALTQ